MINFTDFTYPYKIIEGIEGAEYSERINEMKAFYLDLFMRTVVGQNIWNEMQSDYTNGAFQTEKYQNLFFGNGSDFEGIKPAIIPFLFAKLTTRLPLIYGEGIAVATKENQKTIVPHELIDSARQETYARIGGENYISKIDYGTSIFDYLQANKTDFEALNFHYLEYENSYGI